MSDTETVPTTSDAEAPAGPTPAPIVVCDKCGAIMEDRKMEYWHGRSNSAGCIRTLQGLTMNLNDRLKKLETIFEAAIEKETAKLAAEAPA